jgi:hypothetical protein
MVWIPLKVKLDPGHLLSSLNSASSSQKTTDITPYL